MVNTLFSIVEHTHAHIRPQKRSIWRNLSGRERLVSSSFFLAIKFRGSVGSFVGAMSEPFDRSPHNFVYCVQHLPNILSTFVERMLGKC